jgi:hypothetical protein
VAEGIEVLDMAAIRAYAKWAKASTEERVSAAHPSSVSVGIAALGTYLSTVLDALAVRDAQIERVRALAKSYSRLGSHGVATALIRALDGAS